MTWILYDYTNSKNENEIRVWTESLQKRQIIQLNQKLDMLRQHGTGLLTGLLTNTDSPPILELAINGNVALRPLLCEGPTKDRTGRYVKEFTLLFGAIEKDGKYIPKTSLKIAQKRLQEVKGAITKKDSNTKRCIHERVNTNITR